MAEFKDRLKDLRLEYDMTQKDVASLLGVSNMTISGYERGTRRPDFEKLDTLAERFDVELSYLLGSSSDRGHYPRHLEVYARALSEDLTMKLSHEERAIVKAYRNASDDTKKAVKAVLRVK